MRTRRMRCLFAFAFVFTFPSFGGVFDEEFTDFNTWERQVLTIQGVSETDPITFGSAGISSPVVSVTTSNGRIAGTIWSDCVGQCGNLNGYFGNGIGATTTWTFSKPTFGFGAILDFEGLAGSLALIQNGSNNQWVPLQTGADGIQSAYYSGDGFFGITSPVSFSQIVVWTDFENNSTDQQYTMAEMFIAPDPPLSTPEPESLVLVFIGLSGTALIACTSFRSNQGR
ncbi:MAG: hypothetical protein JOZ36_07065 [Acidobacteria bacterium]|nr:hypothetical protein [Acidobacteriota bacterium]